MKIIIFAGGSGTRFWPISRVNLPKQFVKLKNNTSTLQLTINRIQPVYGWHNIYISTNEKYVGYIKEQVPSLSTINIFTEPARRDLAAAVGLTLVRLRKQGVTEPIFIGWADHIIKNEKDFQEKLREAESVIRKGTHKIVLWGEVPTFANNNLGWIEVGSKKGNTYEFDKLTYRPDQKTTDALFNTKGGLWNTGYWVSTVDYLLSIYEKYQPEIYKKLVEIEESLDTTKESEILEKVYPTIPSISFDEAVVYKINKKDVGVIESKMGWEDPGTLYALKKSLESSLENYVHGKGTFKDSVDSLIFNEDKKKLVVGLNIEETIVVNTKDVIFVTNKEGVRKITDLLKEFEKSKKYSKYL